MHSVGQAAALIAARVTRLGTETVSLRQARGRISACDVFAPRLLPGFDNAAMDGYAARASDLPAELPVYATMPAGASLPTAPVPDRVAVRIFTGAAVPRELDTVVIQERATPNATTRRVALPASPVGDNIRRAGADIATDERAVAAGTRLGPGELGLLAALAIDRVEVVVRPRVALIATGDELIELAARSVGHPAQAEAGDTPADGHYQIVNSSSYMLAASLSELGVVTSDVGIVRDDPNEMSKVLASALEYDAVITTGGVSVGDRDYMRTAFAAAGVELELYKVAMKPGKPFSFGIAGAVPVFGLPGNPVSTFVAFELFVRPAVLALQGAAVTARPRAPVVLVGGYRKPPGRAHYVRATVVRDGERLIAHAHPKQGSAMMTSLVGCNALVEIAAEASHIEPNAVVPAVLLEAV